MGLKPMVDNPIIRALVSWSPVFAFSVIVIVVVFVNQGRRFSQKHNDCGQCGSCGTDLKQATSLECPSCGQDLRSAGIEKQGTRLGRALINGVVFSVIGIFLLWCIILIIN